MPKVVIELQANTQQAIQQIQAFAKAQKDTFDVIRTGNPALAESSIRISKLSESTKAGTKGFEEFHRSATSLAHGALAELLTGIPIVDTAFAKLAHNLSGFPLVIAAVVGAGAGLILWLKSIDTEATKSLAAIDALSQKMAGDLAVSILKLKQIRLGAAGAEGPALAIGADAAIKAAEEARNEAVLAAQQKAKAAQPGVLSPSSFVDFLTRGTSGLVAAQKMQIGAAEKGDIAAADQELATKRIAIQEQLKADLLKIEQRYNDELDKFRTDQVEKAKEAAAKIVEQTKAAVETFKGLGDRFTREGQAVGVAAFLQSTKEEIKGLEALKVALAGGDENLKKAGITTGFLNDAIRELKNRMQDAVAHGMVPMKETAAELPKALEAVATAATATGDAITAAMFSAGRASEGVIGTLNRLAATAKAAMATIAGISQTGAPSGAGLYDPKFGGSVLLGGSISQTGAPGGTGLYGGTYGGTVLGNIVNQPTGSGLVPLTGGQSIYGYGLTSGPIAPITTGASIYGYGLDTLPAGFKGGGGGGILGSAVNQYEGGSFTGAGAPVGGSNLPSYLPNYIPPMFQHGGIVPGSGPMPIIAHGGEEIIPRGRGGGVHIHPGAIQISGTVIDQQRAWGNLVAELGAALATRRR